MVGKYTGLSDAYLSVIKSLQHACMVGGGGENCGKEWREGEQDRQERERGVGMGGGEYT